METRYFIEFSERLRHVRIAGEYSLEEIAGEAKLNVAYLKKIEYGDFIFAPPVYVEGYLRIYAKAIGLEPNDVTREFHSTLKKINYLHSDRAVVMDEKPDLLSDEIDAFNPEAHADIDSELDEAVREKLRREKRSNFIVMGVGGVLAAFSVYFILSDSSAPPQDTRTIAKYDKKSEIYQSKKLEPRKRLAFFLSDPILTEEEKLERAQQREKKMNDSLKIVQNFVSVKGKGAPKAISVQDAAKDLEKRIQP